jgi:hypothetical protein
MQMVSLSILRSWIRSNRKTEVDTTEDLLDGFAEIIDDLDRYVGEEEEGVQPLAPCCAAIVNDIREDVEDALRNAQE